MQNYTHRTKPTKYILQQKKEIGRQAHTSAETAAENALYAEQAENCVNTRPSRTKAKYGAVNGVYAPYFFSAVVTDRIPQGDTFVLSLRGECEHRRRLVAAKADPCLLLRVATRPLAHFAASGKSFAFWAVAPFPQKALAFRGPRIRAEALHPLDFLKRK